MTDEADKAEILSATLQDPLPEGSFFYRRIFSYGVSVAILALLGLIVWRIDGAEQLRSVALYLCLLLFCVITYYMIAPSGEQVVKMFQTAKVLVAGVRLRHDPRMDEPRRSRSDFDAAPRSRRKD